MRTQKISRRGEINGVAVILFMGIIVILALVFGHTLGLLPPGYTEQQADKLKKQQQQEIEASKVKLASIPNGPVKARDILVVEGDDPTIFVVCPTYDTLDPRPYVVSYGGRAYKFSQFAGFDTKKVKIISCEADSKLYQEYAVKMFISQQTLSQQAFDALR